MDGSWNTSVSLRLEVLDERDSVDGVEDLPESLI